MKGKPLIRYVADQSTALTRVKSQRMQSVASDRNANGRRGKIATREEGGEEERTAWRRRMKRIVWFGYRRSKGGRGIEIMVECIEDSRYCLEVQTSGRGYHRVRRSVGGFLSCYPI